jgi:hypothetical protein
MEKHASAAKADFDLIGFIGTTESRALSKRRLRFFRSLLSPTLILLRLRPATHYVGSTSHALVTKQWVRRVFINLEAVPFKAIASFSASRGGAAKFANSASAIGFLY